MAQKVQVILVDDLDGGPADESVTLGLDGTTYEIDLSAANAAKLRDVLAPYVGSARRVSGGGRGSRTRGRSAGASRGGGRDTAAIRAWAREQGIKINERGRIPASVIEQYEKANG